MDRETAPRGEMSGELTGASVAPFGWLVSRQRGTPRFPQSSWSYLLSVWHSLRSPASLQSKDIVLAWTSAFQGSATSWP
jgi:hypothetical protein